MRYIATAVVAFAIGFFTNEYRGYGNPCQRDPSGYGISGDATLEFRESDIVLHVGVDSIILPDAIAFAISQDINDHFRERESL